jgi:hypothetical protein
MKIRGLALFMVFSLAMGVNSASANKPPSPGSSCPRVGATVTSGKLKFTCVKNGKKGRWSKGVAVKAGAGSTATPADSLNFKGAMVYDLKNSYLTRKATSGTYFESDSRSVSAFSPIRAKAFAELNRNPGNTSHPNVEFIYDVRPSFPKSVLEHSKRELAEAAAMWNDVFSSKIRVNVYLVTEQDREYVKSNNWLQNNLPGIFSRFDGRNERPFVSGGGGFWESNGILQGNIVLATASYLDLSYVSYEWPQVAKHEFFHVVQDYSQYKTNRARPNSRGESLALQPQHFREGAANTVGYLTGFRNIGWSSDAMDWMVWQRALNSRSWIDIKSVDDVLRMMVGTEDFEPYESFEMSYAIGSLMYEWVIGTYGRAGFVQLLNQLSTAATFEEALQRSIGLSKSDFYAKSAPYVFSVFESTR